MDRVGDIGHTKLGLILPGLIGGFAKIAVDTTLAPLFVSTPTDFLQRTSAILLGPSALEPGAHSFVAVACAALFVHFALAVTYGCVFVALLAGATRRACVLAGVAFGLALYLLNLFGFAGLFPFFAPLRGFAQAASHAIFCVVVALVYVALRPRPTVSDRTPAPRPAGRMVY